MSTELHSVRAIAAATPVDRDRYLDLLRAVGVFTVVIGHWLLAVVWVEDGALHVTTVLDALPRSRAVTWFLQVMPLFFLVGGAVNLRSWRATRDRGGSYPDWVSRRAARLLRPSSVLVWAWVAIATSAIALGVERSLVEVAGRSALVPLWFLAVYLVLVALLPVLARAYARAGLLLVPALLIVAVLTDAAGRTLPALGYANYLWVWAVPTVLGFAWHDGRFDGFAARIGLPLTGAAAMAAAIGWLDYPVALVRVAQAGGPQVPATLAFVACVQAGVAFAVRRPLTNWLQRPRVWAAVVTANSMAMTVYLWHLTVLVLAVGALQLTGPWWSVAPLSIMWWATRPLWIVGLFSASIPVIAAMLPVERMPISRSMEGRPMRERSSRVAPTIVSVVVASAAVAAVVTGAFEGVSGVGAAVVLTVAGAALGAFGAMPSHAGSDVRTAR